MRTKLNITEGIFPMPVLMVATYNEDGSVNVMNAASSMKEILSEKSCFMCRNSSWVISPSRRSS